MKVSVISDLHYNRRVFHDIDESKAWDWLLGIVDLHKPDLLISLGDWGEAINEAEFYELLKKVRVWSIYGNHENLEVLKKMYNILVDSYEPILMNDGEVRELNGIKFGVINGIIALRRKEKKGIPRKRSEKFVEVTKRLASKVDVLLLHDSPRLPLPECKDIANNARTRVVEEAIRIVKPRETFCGHLHISPYTVHRFSFKTLYVRVDSSHRCYAILDLNDLAIEIWRDREISKVINIDG